MCAFADIFREGRKPYNDFKERKIFSKNNEFSTQCTYNDLLITEPTYFSGNGSLIYLFFYDYLLSFPAIQNQKSKSTIFRMNILPFPKNISKFTRIDLYSAYLTYIIIYVVRTLYTTFLSKTKIHDNLSF